MNMRIIVVAPDYPYPVIGGLQKQAHELNQQLIEMGCEILVVSCKHQRSSPGEEVVDGIRVLRAPYLPWLRPRLILNAIWSTFQVLLKSGRYKVVHIHNLSTLGAVVAVAARLRKVPVIMKLPNVGSMGIPGLRKYMFGDGILFLLKSVSAFVAMAEKSVEELQEIQVPERKIFKMVNGINLETFDAAISQKALAASSSVDVIFTGRLMSSKGVGDLLEAWSRLSKSGMFEAEAVRLRIVGDGPDRSRLEQIVRELEIKDSVCFEGYSRTIPQELKKSSIFVLPSYSEGNSNSVLEAMAAGLPVVSTDVGGTSLLMGPSAKDYVIEPGDIDGLVGAVRSLLLSPDLRKDLGARMRARVEQLFDIRVVASGYYSAYQALAADRKADMGRLASPAFDTIDV